MLNKVTLIGRLGKDPEHRALQSGKEVTTFSMATWERYKDQSGETKEITEWHNCVIWGPQASTASKYLKKGSMIYFEGKKVTREWDDKDGNKRHTVEIVGNFMFIPQEKAKEKQPTVRNEVRNGLQANGYSDTRELEPNTESETIEMIEPGDDLPF